MVRCSRFVVRCSKDNGEVQQKLCKDCGEVVNNWLVNWRDMTHAQLQTM